MTELSSKSGMYSASTTAAMTTPITTRITGSMSVMNRASHGGDETHSRF